MNLISVPDDISSKDQPLREDVHLLGRILGDTLREQEGEAYFQLIENVRKAAVRFRKTHDERDGATLDSMLDGLSSTESLAVVRAFSYFSQLSNIAEDLHHNRRHRAQLKAGFPATEGSLKLALDRLEASKPDKDRMQSFLNSALVSPVLTAHPTEVQRKSILDSQLYIASVLSDRDRIDMTPDDLAENEEALRRAVLTLWQTRMLRLARLTVRDEINNGLEYYRYTFLVEIPKIYANLEKQFETRFAKDITVPPLLRIGSWIGGDRDGNPFVTSDVMLAAVQQQSALAFEHYLTEIYVLSRSLSLTDRLADVSDELRRLSDASPDTDPARADEPYRRALNLIYSRLSATSKQFGHAIVHQPPLGADAQPYRTPQEFIADLDILIDSLLKHGAVPLAKGRLADLRRAVEVFSFHLAPLDMRQHSSIIEQTVGELYSCSLELANYTALDEFSKRKALLETLQAGKNLLTDIEIFSAVPQSELRIMLAAAQIHHRFGHSALPNHIISKTDAVSDMLELALMLQQVGLLQGSDVLHVNIIPLFETIDDLRIRECLYGHR